MAASFLQRRGVRVLRRNLRVGRGEIDLLVADRGVLVAVEVKTRIGGDPRDAITDEKQRRLGNAVSRMRPRPRRVDLVAVRLTPEGVWVRWLRGM